MLYFSMQLLYQWRTLDPSVRDSEMAEATNEDQDLAVGRFCSILINMAC
jgi:hypothetical protein